MDFDASFEEKLQEHLEAVRAAAEAAKSRVARGVAGLRPSEPSAPEAPTAQAAEPSPSPKRTGPAVSFGDVDDVGASVWEDPK